MFLNGVKLKKKNHKAIQSFLFCNRQVRIIQCPQVSLGLSGFHNKQKSQHHLIHTFTCMLMPRSSHFWLLSLLQGLRILLEESAMYPHMMETVNLEQVLLAVFCGVKCFQILLLLGCYGQRVGLTFCFPVWFVPFSLPRI